MTYGVEALPLLREEVEDCPPTKAKLVLIDEFCELNEKNYNFVCYVKLYFTTEEIIVARRKIWKTEWKNHTQAFTFSRVHKITDIVLKKELYLTDIITIVDSSKDQAFYYQIHFSGDLKEWVVAFERISKWYENKRNKQEAITTTEAEVDEFEAEAKTINGSYSNRLSAVVLWSRAECHCVDTTARSNSVSSSQDLSSHLVTPVRNNRLSNPLCKETVPSCEEDVSSSPEPQESSAFDLDNTSISEEGDTNKEEMDQTCSLALEAWTPSNDIATTSSCEAQVIPDDKIRTLDTAVCNKGHSRNKSTSLTRGVQIVTRSDSTISAAMSDPGAGDSRMTVQPGLAYANLPAVLRSISCNSRSNSFLSSPLRHTQIRGKKVKFSPRQKMFATCPTDDSGSEQCLVYENDAQDDSFCSITPENSTTPTDNNEDSITPTPLTPIRSAPTTKQEKGATLAAHGSGLALTLPKRKLVSKLFRRRTTSSISDIDDSHTDMDSAETPKVFKKKFYQLDPKMIASQLVLLDAEMLRKIKPEELKGGAWVGKNKETRAPNVMKMVKDFNRLALLVPTEILEEKTASARAKVITCYIQIADKCRNFGNYNSLKAILAGLQCTPIYRLKKTWKEVSGRRKKKFEDLSHLMSEEDNWKVYKIELRETLAKGTCVPFLGQFLTQILQQETVKEVITYRKKSQGRRPQSSELSADSRETLSAPTSPVNSGHNDVMNTSEIVSPTDLDESFDEQKTPTPSNVQPDAASNQETKPEEVTADDIKNEATQVEEGNKKEPSSTSTIERRDTLSPLPIGKFKKNQLSPTSLYKESFKKSSALHSPNASGMGQQTGSGKIVENGDIASNKLNNAVCEVVKTISLESLDSYDGASSCYSRGSTPARDVPNVLDSEAEDTYYNNDILDISQVELNIDDTLDTPMSDFDREGSPFTDPTASTPTEDNPVFTDINTATEDNEVVVTEVKKPGKKKRRWNSFRRKCPPPEAASHSATNCTDDTARKKGSVKSTLKRRLSSPLRSFSTPACNDDGTQKKEKGLLKRFSPSREGSPVCNDDSAQKKEKGFLKRRFSPSRESSPVCNDESTPKKEKGFLKRRLSPSRETSPVCNDESTPKKENGFLKRRFSPSREGSPVCNDDSTSKKEKGFLKRRFSPSREASPVCDDSTPKKEKGFLKRTFSPSREASPVCNDDSTPKKEKGFLKKGFSPSREGSPVCNDESTEKKEKSTLRKNSSPSRETSPTCDDDTPRKKEKRGLRRKLSSPLRGHSSTECSNDASQKREKLHIYKHSDDVDGFNANSMLQQMQFSSMRYMSSIDPRANVQAFIKGLSYNSEEDNYHMSIQVEPIEQNC